VSKLADDPSVIKNDKLRDKVAAAADRLRLNLELVRLDDDLPLPVAVKDLGLRPDPQAVLEVARRCEFRSLLAEYEKLVAAGGSKQGELF
jgi:5'-3' exonuclease